MSTVISCKHLAKQFGKDNARVQALRDITIDINKGETMMLVGPSGCGKTTLLSIIAGILDPSEGGCNVLGQDIHSMTSSDKVNFRAKHIGFVFQSYHLLPALTAKENIALPLLIQKYHYSDALNHASLLLDQVGLKGRGDALPKQLSGGQQQRVAIARALIHQPDIIVCDEPTSALDHQTGVMVMDLMINLKKEHGHTQVIVTHDSRIFPYADRIGKMDDGVIIGIEEGPHDEHQ